MRILGIFLGAVLLFFFFLTSPSTADIISVKIRTHNRNIILFSKFEFSTAGYVSVAVSSVRISAIPIISNLSQPNPSRIGFFLLSDEWLDRYDQFKENPNLCPFDNKSISVLFTFQDLSPPSQSAFNKSHHVTYPGEYSLYFANCNDLSLVTMDVRTELYNTDDDGTTKDYLSARQPRPSLYSRFSLIYLCFLGFWILISVKNKQYFQMIHLLMGVLLVMNVIYFICTAANQHDLMVTGTHHGWRILFYISHSTKDMYFFTVLVLIGAGWSFRKPFLLQCEIFILTIVILLEVWANVSSIAVWESGPYNEDWFNSIENIKLIDIICCFVVFFHFLNSIVEFKWDTDTSHKDTSVRQVMFTVFVFIYIFYSRQRNSPLESSASLESINLVFSMVMFYMYRPFLYEDEDLKSKGFLDHTGV